MTTTVLTHAPMQTTMTRIGGLAGNRGRNLLHVADLAPGGAELAVVLTDNAEASVLEGAEERGIATEVVERGDDEPRGEHERRILDRLETYDVDLVALDGYMRVLTETFLETAPTTLNIHPSLLPAFSGRNAHEQVLEAGVRTTGCTVHVVTGATDEAGDIDLDRVDEGPIVTQEAVPVYDDDDAKTLKNRVLHRGEFTAYPRAIRWFAEDRVAVDKESGTVAIAGDEAGILPARRTWGEDRAADLRYGENPHQDAALYRDVSVEEPAVVGAPQLNEGAKAMSYNNYNDADAALGLVREFDRPAAAVIKHTNPAGCATAKGLAEAYKRALSTDAKSAFGGVVALNRECDEPTAGRIIESYKEVVVAPGYTEDALRTLNEKENLRVLDVGTLGDPTENLTEKKLVGGRLVQERDLAAPTREDLEVVTEREPSDAQVESLLFAWRTIKHVKSNAILFADGTETVGVGAGQVSRVDAVEIATMKAQGDAEGKSADGAVMASDAFFPFPDGIEKAAEAGIEAVIQPGGSVNDDDVIAAADDHDMAMVFTGQRAFRHD
jgi:phosphoribosylaminoimidazolecarboxamide formyltransferase